MKKRIIYIIIFILLIIIIIRAISFYNKGDYFYIKTPLKEYSQLSSSTKGIPFNIICNNTEKKTIEISSGELIDNKNNLTKENENLYYVDCNSTIYWIPNTNEKKNTIIIFKSANEKIKNYYFKIKPTEENIYKLIEIK